MPQHLFQEEVALFVYTDVGKLAKPIVLTMDKRFVFLTENAISVFSIRTFSGRGLKCLATYITNGVSAFLIALTTDLNNFMVRF